MMIKLLGISSERKAAEVISKKKGQCLPSSEDNHSAGGIGVDLQRKIRSLRLHGCWSAWLFICTSISQLHSTCKPIIKVRKDLKLACYGPTVENK